MTDKKSPPENKSTTPAGSSVAGKKPHATLDLKATEIKANEKDAAKAAATGTSAGAGDENKATDKAADKAAETPKATTGSGAVPQAGGKPAAPTSSTAGATTGTSTGTSSVEAKPDQPVKATDKGAAGKDDKAPATGASIAATAGARTDQSKSGGKDGGRDGGKGSGGGGGREGGSPPPPRRSSGGGGIGAFFSHAVAGLIGGFLMLLGADALQPQVAELKTQLGLPDRSQQDATGVGELATRLAALEKQQSEGSAGDGERADLAEKLDATQARLAEVEGLKQEIEGLRSAQSSLAETTQKLAETGPAGEGGGVAEERIARLEQQLETMTAFAETNQDSGVVPRLAKLTGRMADLEQTLQNQIAAVRASVGEDVETRLNEIETSSEAARSGTQRIDRQLSGVANDTARLSQQIETLKAETKRLSDTLRAVQEETATVASRLSGFEGDVGSKIAKLASPQDVESAVKPVAEQVDSLQKRVETVVSAEQDRKENAQRVVLTLELANLERAIERGDRFGEELAQVKKTAGGLIDVSKLEAYDEKGVATVNQLQTQFRPVTHRIIEASATPAGDSVIDQLLANARSVVKVRKVDHADDDNSPEAIVARIEGALSSGRLGDVLELAKSLPDGGQSAAGDWLKRVEERHAVDLALANVSEQLKASLSGEKTSTN